MYLLINVIKMININKGRYLCKNNVRRILCDIYCNLFHRPNLKIEFIVYNLMQK